MCIQPSVWLRLMYIGKVFWWKHLWFCPLIPSSLIDLLTIGNTAQIAWFLFVPCHPRWPRQVRGAEWQTFVSKTLPIRDPPTKITYFHIASFRVATTLWPWTYVIKLFVLFTFLSTKLVLFLIDRRLFRRLPIQWSNCNSDWLLSCSKI